MISTPPLRLAQWLAIPAIALLAPVAAAQPTGPASEVIARIGTERVLRQDVDRRLLAEGIYPGSATAAQRNRVARQLTAEHVVEQRYASGGAALPEGLEAAIEDSRRRLMLDYHLRQRLEPYRPTDAEIARFVARNPRFFGSRETLRYQQLRIVWKSPANRAAVVALLGRFRDAPSRDAAAINGLKNALVAAGADFEGGTLVRSTEQIAPEQWPRLATLTPADPVRLTLAPGEAELIVLLDRVADPADPALMKNQIAALLAREHAQRQRQQLVDRLAATTAITEAPAAEPPVDAVAPTPTDTPDLRSRLRIVTETAIPAGLEGNGGKLALFLLLVAMIAPATTSLGLLREGRVAGWRWHRVVLPALHLAIAVTGLATAVALRPGLDTKVLAGLLVAAGSIGGLLAWRLHRRDEPPRILLVVLYGIAAMVTFTLGGLILSV